MGHLCMKKHNYIFLNTIIPLLSQFITMLCGFILPRMILSGFGSEVNGAASAVSQFLGIINFFDMGVTAVFQSALYKPLASKDNALLGQIVTSADRFFNNIGRILIGYIIILCFVFPFDNSFSPFFWITLVIAMGINSIGQYYLGVVDRIILIADQKFYFVSIIQTLTIIISTILNVILINSGVSIQIVKLSTSLIFLSRPIIYRIYIKKKYSFNRKEKITGEPLTQKWNGVAQHIAAVVLDGTDTIVLKFFSTLINVSIYHMYFLVVTAVKTVFMSMTNAISPYLGKLWADNSEEKAGEVFEFYEWIISFFTTIIFGCTSSLIVPFIMIYTRGVEDADYNQPLFSLLLVLAVAFYCLRLPYSSMINATGSYKQTQKIYVLATITNIIISVVAVHWLGLIGVTIGTLVSLTYQTIHMMVFCARELFHGRKIQAFKLWIIDGIIFSCCYFICTNIDIRAATYYEWVIKAGVTLIVWTTISIFFWLITERDYMLRFWDLLRKLLYRKK